MAVLKRNVRMSSKAIKSTAYTALVRPHVWYCSAVWDPYTKKQTQRVDVVQQRAARWVCGKFRQGLNCTGPTEMISHLGWNSAEKGSTSDLVMQDGQQFGPDVNKVPAHPRSSQYKGHASTCLHAHVPHPKWLNQYYSFLPWTVTEWNDLPNRIAIASSLEAFKTSVMKHRAWHVFNQPTFSFSTGYSLLLSNLTHFFSVLAPLPRRWTLISLLVSALSFPHFPVLYCTSHSL